MSHTSGCAIPGRVEDGVNLGPVPELSEIVVAAEPGSTFEYSSLGMHNPRTLSRNPDRQGLRRASPRGNIAALRPVQSHLPLRRGPARQPRGQSRRRRGRRLRSRHTFGRPRSRAFGHPRDPPGRRPLPGPAGPALPRRADSAFAAAAALRPRPLRHRLGPPHLRGTLAQHDRRLQLGSGAMPASGRRYGQGIPDAPRTRATTASSGGFSTTWAAGWPRAHPTPSAPFSHAKA